MKTFPSKNLNFVKNTFDKLFVFIQEAIIWTLSLKLNIRLDRLHRNLLDLVNPFHTNPLAIVCGMGGGGFRPPLISQPLMGLEGCFLVQCAFIKDLSTEKKILKITQKIRPRAAKTLQKHFLVLISWNILQFWSHFLT